MPLLLSATATPVTCVWLRRQLPDQSMPLLLSATATPVTCVPREPINHLTIQFLALTWFSFIQNPGVRVSSSGILNNRSRPENLTGVTTFCPVAPITDLCVIRGAWVCPTSLQFSETSTAL